MRKKLNLYLPAALLWAILLAVTLACQEKTEIKEGQKKQSERVKTPGKITETSQSIQKEVDSLSQNKVDEKRKEVIQEAISAIRETENALTALDSNKTKEALDALAKVTGKLELIVAREPDLAMAPMDVNVVSYDVLTTLDDIKKMRKEAEKHIDDGDLQDARRLIAGLRSEMVVSVVSIPLATYPEAIKAISPLIDKGKIEEARIALANVLNTLVITDHILPLPVVRAEEMLKLAETLAEKNERTKEENDTLATLLENSRYQLQMAEALGYGDKKEYRTFYSQLDEIEKKTEKGNSGDGFFDNIKDSIATMRKRIFK